MDLINKEDFPGRNKLKERLGPGIWIDQDDNLHFSVEELLAKYGIQDTPENRKVCSEACMQAFNEWAKNNNVQQKGLIRRDHPEDWQQIQ